MASESNREEKSLLSIVRQDRAYEFVSLPVGGGFTSYSQQSTAKDKWLQISLDVTMT
jgi:hypothetical protein